MLMQLLNIHSHLLTRWPGIFGLVAKQTFSWACFVYWHGITPTCVCTHACMHTHTLQKKGWFLPISMMKRCLEILVWSFCALDQRKCPVFSTETVMLNHAVFHYMCKMFLGPCRGILVFPVRWLMCKFSISLKKGRFSDANLRSEVLPRFRWMLQSSSGLMHDWSIYIVKTLCSKSFQPYVGIRKPSGRRGIIEELGTRVG